MSQHSEAVEHSPGPQLRLCTDYRPYQQAPLEHPQPKPGDSAYDSLRLHAHISAFRDMSLIALKDGIVQWRGDYRHKEATSDSVRQPP